MTVTILVAFVTLLIASCVSTQPMTMAEMFPTRNVNAQIGIIVIEGQPATNLVFRDAAGRIVEQWGERGASPALTYNGRSSVRIYLHQLPLGNYQVEMWPFYYRLTLFSGRMRYDLPKQTASIWVDRNPSAYYEGQYTKRHWGWILYVYTGSVPDYDPGAIGLPRVNISGSGVIGDAIEWYRGR